MTTVKKFVIFDVIKNLFIKKVTAGKAHYVMQPGAIPKLFDTVSEAEEYLMWFPEGIYEIRSLFFKYEDLRIFENSLKHTRLNY